MTHRNRALLLAAALAVSLSGAAVTSTFAQNQPANPAGQPAPVPAAPALPAKETLIGTMKEGETQTYTLSNDSASVAILKKVNDKYVMSVNGQDQKPYDWIVRGSVGFTGDSKTLGYVAQQGDKVMAVINGREGKPYHEIRENYIAFGPASRYVYFGKAEKNGKWICVADGNEVLGNIHDLGSLGFSEDGKRYAFAAERDDKRFFVIDGKEGQMYSKVAGASFSFSPDGQRVGYVIEKDGKLVPVVDGQEQQAYTEVTRPIFSPDSKHVAFAAKLGDKRMAVFVDGKPHREFEMVMGQSIVFSPDGNRIAYVAGRNEAAGNKLFYVIDGQPEKEYDQILANSFVFSPNSQRWAFQAVTITPLPNGQRRGNVVVNLDGIEGKEFDQVGLLQFSPNSRQLAYLGQRENRAHVVVNGSTIADYDTLGYLAYAKEGNRLAYVASRGADNFLVVDNKPGKSYAGIVNTSVAWSADGKNVAYEARRPGENGKNVIVVNEAESAEHDGTLRGTRLVWDSPTALHALILRDQNKIIRWEANVR